jgi:hypothetical protein
MQKYETSSVLASPLVTVHTTADPVVPFWREWWYRVKVEPSRSAGLHTGLPVFRFGHCEFNATELLLSFGLVLLQASGRPMSQISEHPLPTVKESMGFVSSIVR